MAFSATGFNAVGGQSKSGNAPAIWTYSSTDAQSVIRVSGYFNSNGSACYWITGGRPFLHLR